MLQNRSERGREDKIFCTHLELNTGRPASYQSLS
jgi:hypothetical protein